MCLKSDEDLQKNAFFYAFNAEIRAAFLSHFLWMLYRKEKRTQKRKERNFCGSVKIKIMIFM